MAKEEEEFKATMKIEILEEDKFKVRFILYDAPIAFANSFRRAMKSLVPVMAVDYIDVYLNSSYLFDENLAHRIGLIPIKTELDRFNLPENCVCGGEGCPNCQVSFRLNVEGPKVVYSGDFVSDDESIKPAFDNIPIIELFKGQQLMIEAVARLGTGKEHSKFQPVSICAYKIIPEIDIKDSCNNCNACVEACPRGVFENKNGKIVVKDVLSCSMCMECVKSCEEDAIELTETNNYLFTVEGVGQLPVKKVMIEALKIIREKASEMNKLIEELV